MAETLSSIFGNDEQDLAEPPGSSSRILSSSTVEPRPSGSLEDDLRSAQQEDAITQMQAVRQAQAQSLQQHAQYRAGLEQAQSQVDLRAEDLKIANQALGIFDTGAEPSVREYRYKHLVRQLGVDHKSETAKDLWKLIKGLSPDSAMAVRQNLTGQIRGANPGQVAQVFQGVLRGQVDPLELFSATRPQPQGREAFYQQYGPPSYAGAADGQQQQSVGPTASDVAGEIAQQTTDAKTPPDLRQAHPSLVEMYDLDPTRPWTNGDLVKRGYRGPMDLKGQEKFVADNKEVIEGSTRLIENFMVMEYSMRGRPEAIPITIGAPGLPGGEFRVPTLSEIATAIDSGASSIAGVLIPEAFRNAPNDALDYIKDALSKRQQSEQPKLSTSDAFKA